MNIAYKINEQNYISQKQTVRQKQKYIQNVCRMYLCMYNQIIVHVRNQKFRLNKSTVDVIYSFHFLYYYYCHLYKNSGKSEKEMSTFTNM